MESARGFVILSYYLISDDEDEMLVTSRPPRVVLDIDKIPVADYTLESLAEWASAPASKRREPGMAKWGRLIQQHGKLLPRRKNCTLHGTCTFVGVN